MAWNLLRLPVQMAQENDREQAGEELAPVAKKPPGGGKAGRLAGALVTYGLQFLLMLGAVLVGGLIGDKLEGGTHADPAAEAEPEEPAAGKAPAPAKAKKAAAAPGAPARYFALEPPLVVNLSENGAVRYLQVNVEVMARDAKIIESVQQNVPLIRNDLVQLLSDRPPAELMSREGREKMRAEAQLAVNSILEREAGGARIESLLFTGFVVQ
jgi:flagellar FliL protein